MPEILRPNGDNYIHLGKLRCPLCGSTNLFILNIDLQFGRTHAYGDTDTNYLTVYGQSIEEGSPPGITIGFKCLCNETELSLLILQDDLEAPSDTSSEIELQVVYDDETKSQPTFYPISQ